MSAIDNARTALADFDEHGIIFGPDVATALRALITDHEDLTSYPTADDREVLRALLNVDHGHGKMPGGHECRTCLRRVDAILEAGFRRPIHTDGGS